MTDSPTGEPLDLEALKELLAKKRAILAPHARQGQEAAQAGVVLADALQRLISDVERFTVPAPTSRVLAEVADERTRQHMKHGDQSHLPDGTEPSLILRDLPQYQSAVRADHLALWAKARCKAASQNEGGDGSITMEQILTEEWAEAIAEVDPVKFRAELIQVAAVAVQWVEKLDGSR